MVDVVISVYFNGRWEVTDGSWRFDDVKECKALVLKDDSSFEELESAIAQRFKVDTSAFQG